MPLQSRLFRGDHRLEACLVNDAAHLTIGAQGAHVGKVQRAVTTLSGAVIDAREMQVVFYGHSTAKAVLAYKQDRQIINRSYQKQADDIVGKMTIRSLDDEMLRVEASVSPCPSCGDPVHGSRPAPMAFASNPDTGRPSLGFAVSNTILSNVGTFTGRITSTLNISWQITTLAADKNGRRLGDQMAACNQLIRDLLIVPKGGDLNFIKPVPFTMTIKANVRSDIFSLRIAAGKALQLPSSQLRVIVHCFEPNSPEFGITDWGTYDGKTYSPFVVLNANKERSDKLTLLHEMIHATGLTVHDGDASDPASFPDFTSVFSTNETRDHIRDVHLERLRTMPWCEPWMD